MAEGINKAIEELEKKLEGIMKQASDIKKAINQLLVLNDEPIRYQDTDVEIKGRIPVAPDEFFGKPLATAVRDFLKRRGQAVPLVEIYEALKQGGFRVWWRREISTKGFGHLAQ